MIHKKTLICREVREHNAEQVIKFSCHQVTLHHLWPRSHRCLKALQRAFYLLFQRYCGKYVDRQAHRIGIHQGDIAVNDIRFFQRPDPPPARRGGKTNALSQLGRQHDAIDPLRRATELDGKNCEAPYRLGEAYYGMGDYRQAVEAGQRATRCKKAYPAAAVLLGDAYL